MLGFRRCDDRKNEVVVGWRPTPSTLARHRESFAHHAAGGASSARRVAKILVVSLASSSSPQVTAPVGVTTNLGRPTRKNLYDPPHLPPPKNKKPAFWAGLDYSCRAK